MNTATRLAIARSRPAERCTPTEQLWTLMKDGVRWTAEVRNQGKYGWELQLLRNETIFFGHRHVMREAAVAEALQQRHGLEARGWRREW